MLLNNKLRSVYSRAVYSNVIAIIDHADGKSVTNDAENVIADLVRQGFDLSQYRVIYKDTRGIWDQMLVDRTGSLRRLQQHQRARPPLSTGQAHAALTKAAPGKTTIRKKIANLRTNREISP